MNYERVAGRIQQSMSKKLASTIAQYEADLALQAEEYETELETLREQLKEQDVELAEPNSE